MRGRDWQRYAAPAAFLLAATIAVLLVRSGLHAGGTSSQTPASAVTTPQSRTGATTGRTRTGSNKHAGRRFWSVHAGDTFAVISAKFGVPITTLEKLNPKVKTTSLFIGERIRVR